MRRAQGLMIAWGASLLLAGCTVTAYRMPQSTDTPGSAGTTTGGTAGQVDIHLTGALNGNITGPVAHCGNESLAGLSLPPGGPSPDPNGGFFILQFRYVLAGVPGSFIGGLPRLTTGGTYQLRGVSRLLVRYGDVSNPYLPDDSTYNRSVTGPHGHVTWMNRGGVLKAGAGGRNGSIDVDLSRVVTGQGFEFSPYGPVALHVRGTFRC